MLEPLAPLHTPGPWRLWTSLTEPGQFIVHGDSPHTVEGGEGTNLLIAARLIGTPVGFEGVANAHLIAAAPDLLAACKGLVDLLNDDLEPEQCAAWDAVIAAIRKAEGWTTGSCTP